MAKPTIIPEWDTTEVNSIVPDSDHKDEGWLAPGGVPEKPPFQTFNHWQNNVYKWINELNIKGILGYDALTDYVANLSYTVGSDGILYACSVNNGPSSAAVNPVGDVTGTWQKQGQSSAPVLYTASGTYSKPAGLNFIKITVIGGGGGGGGVDGQGAGTFAAGGGGGGGGNSKATILASALSASETVTIGAGGAGGAGFVNGTAGGTTSLGTLIQATGGGGGQGDNATTGVATSDSGNGGAGTLGDVNGNGFPGSVGVALDASASRHAGGNGGGTILGGGGQGPTGDVDGNDGVSYGSGGSGASVDTVSTNYTGGDGVDGIIIIEEFF